jgi:hypothetical protein
MLNKRLWTLMLPSFLMWISAWASVQAGGLHFMPEQINPIKVKLLPIDASEVWRGETQVQVFNDGTTPQSVSVAYVLSTSGQIISVGATPPTKSDVKVTTTSSLPLLIKNGTAPTVLKLTYTVPPNRPTSELDGVLIVRGASAGFEVALPVTFQLPQAPVPNAVSPAKVTINVTQLLPFIRPDLLNGGQVYSTVMWNGKGMTDKQSEWLSSDTGGMLKVNIPAMLKDKIKTDRPYRISVSNVRAAGTYTGTLNLRPGDEHAPKIEVTTKVQHVFVWPLLTILGGCFMAFQLILRRELLRPRELLLARLVTIRESYRIALYNILHVPDPLNQSDLTFIYDDILDLTAGSPTSPASIADRINHASRQEELTALAGEIDGLEASIAVWETNQRNMVALRSQCLSLKKFIKGAGLTTELRDAPTFRLIGLALKAARPMTAQAAGTHSTNLQNARDNIGWWQQGVNTYPKAQQAFQELLQGKKVTIDSTDNPKTILIREFGSASGPSELAEAAQHLKSAKDIFIQKLGHRRLTEDHPPMSLNFVEASAKTSKQAPRTAADILQGVKRSDTFDFGLSFFLAVVGYFITIYSKGTFGAWYEYVAAFLYGGAGTLLVKSASLAPILPWQRSLRLTSSNP